MLSLIGLVATPVLLGRLGTSSFGLWVLASGLSYEFGYLRVGDLGLQPATVRRIASALGANDTAAARTAAYTGAGLMVVLGLLAGLAVSLVAPVLVGVFRVDGSLRAEASAVFRLCGPILAAEMAAAGPLAVLEGVQRFGAVRVVEGVYRLVLATVAVLVVLGGGGIVGLAMASLAVNLLRAVAVWVWNVHYWAGIGAPTTPHGDRGDGARAAWVIWRDLFRLGRSMLALKSLAVVFRTMDRVLLGVAAGPSVVAGYEVVYKVYGLAAVLVSAVPAVVGAGSAYAGARDGATAVGEIYRRGSAFLGLVTAPVVVSLMVLAEPLIRVWVGAEYSGLAMPTRVLLVAPLASTVVVVGNAALSGWADPRRVVRLELANVGLNLALSIALVWNFGIDGVVTATAVSAVVTLPAYVRMHLRAFGVTPAAWWREVASTIAIAAVAAGIVAGIALALAPARAGLTGVAGAGVLSLAASLAVVLLVRPSERAWSAALLRRGTAPTG